MIKLRRSIFTLSIILVTLTITGAAVLFAQEPTPTHIPIDTGMVIVFPNLDCSAIEAPFQGPTWNGITIGSSTINDLRNYINELSSSYTENSTPSFQETSFSIPSILAEGENIPPVVSACVHPDDEQITAISVLHPTGLDQIHLQELVVEYGVPDLVLWDELLESRVVVWLTEGIAASVSVDASEQFVPYGTVTRMVYFPYQSLEGYEERWPFTHRAAPRPEYVTLTPELPSVTNPFDFDAMLATITAEPSRTPTPTVTPTP